MTQPAPSGVELPPGATSTPDTPDARAEPTRRSRALAPHVRRLREVGVLAPFIVVFVLLSIRSDAFLTSTNLLNILDQQSAILMIAAAGTLVLIAGGIDLSVAAVYGLASVVCAMVAASHSTPLGVAAGLAVGLVAGTINGLVSTVLRINPLIATLAMSFVIAGIANLTTEGNLILLTDRPDFANLSQTTLLGVRTSIWIMVLVVAALGLLLARTTVGRHLYAVGGSQEAARLSGVRVDGIKILTFTLSGGAAALAGILDASRVLSAQATVDSSLTFTVLAGIVVGGTSILGGEGQVWRTVVGVLFIALVGNGITLLGLNPLYSSIVLGTLILVAVGIDAWSRSRRR